MDTIREKLWMLRDLRMREADCKMRAQEQLALATKGMSARRATNMGGTGRCPLSDHALSYGAFRDQAAACRQKADALAVEIMPPLARLTRDEYRVLGLYYDAGMDWQDIQRVLERSGEECMALHRAALNKLEREARA